MVQGVDNCAVPRSVVVRVIRRRNAMGTAALVALGLTASCADWREADAGGNGRAVVRVAKKYEGARRLL